MPRKLEDLLSLKYKLTSYITNNFGDIDNGEFRDDLVKKVKSAKWDHEMIIVSLEKKVFELVNFLEEKLINDAEIKTWWFLVIDSFMKMNERRVNDKSISSLTQVYKSITKPKKICRSTSEDAKAEYIFEGNEGENYVYIGKKGHFQRIVLDSFKDEYGVCVDKWKTWVQIINRGKFVKNKTWKRWDE